MKRINPAKKEWMTRQAEASFLHRQSRKNKSYNRYRHITIDPSIPPRKRNAVDLEVPRIFCLTKHYDETVSFLGKFRATSLQSNIQVRLRLEECQKITPPAMLLLLAEVHRSRLLRGPNAVTGTYPSDPALLRRMCHTGFFDLLQIKSPIKSERTFPMEYIKFRTGVKLEARSARELRNSMLGDAIKMRVRAKNQLQRGVTEAMLNALQHAYPHKDQRYRPARDRWWLTGHYHRPSGNLSVMFCDLGVGIPSTLPRKHSMERLRQLASLLPGVPPDDGAMILAGMKVGRTSTGKYHRGKGLNDLRQFIDQANGGELKIYSRAGEYSYTSSTSETHKTHGSAVGGTLIVWTVPIKNIAELITEHDDDDGDIQNIEPIQ